MLKNLSQLELIVDGKAIRLVCENDTPLGSIKECLFQFSKYIGQVEDNLRAQAEQAAKEQEKKEAPTPEV